MTRRQLLDLGFTRHQIEHRIRIGLLVPIHRGVYLAGYTRAPLAHEAAAILACQPRAILAGATSARLLRLPVDAADEIEVLVAARWRRSLEGVRVGWIAHLPAVEVRRHDGLPIASPSLTLLDLAARLSARRLAALLNEARVLRLVTDAELHATIDAHPRRKGVAALGRLLANERGPRITRSVAERRALRVMRAHGIEPDSSDVQIGPYRVDFWFERERVAVEVDGYRYHSTPKRFADDRRRAAYLAGRGVQLFPLTWHDLGPESGRAMSNLRAALTSRRHLFLSSTGGGGASGE